MRQWERERQQHIRQEWGPALVAAVFTAVMTRDHEVDPRRYMPSLQRQRAKERGKTWQQQLAIVKGLAGSGLGRMTSGNDGS